MGKAEKMQRRKKGKSDTSARGGHRLTGDGYRGVMGVRQRARLKILRFNNTCPLV